MSDPHDDATSLGPSTRPRACRFSERHRRVVDAPFDAVWAAAGSVAADEIRAFGPLIALRGLPARLRGTRQVAGSTTPGTPLLDLFESEGFVRLREFDDGDRRGFEFGAIGRFWHPTRNQPIRFDTAEEFSTFDEPGHAVIWFDLVVERRGGTVEVSTTTLVNGTDAAAERRFAPYWALIRLPSGVIRRSWLAAIERRARR